LICSRITLLKALSTNFPEHRTLHQGAPVGRSMDGSLRTFGALHLAAALAEGLTLVTRIREFARAGKRHKVQHLTDQVNDSNFDMGSQAMRSDRRDAPRSRQY